MTKPDVTTSDIPRLNENTDFRSIDMHLMNEAMARAHCTEQRELAAEERRVRRLLAARRMDRRAARAAQRALRLSAAAALHRRSY